MRYVWDENKEKINIEKHGIDFETASLVFEDENRIEYYDEAHSIDEERYITIGMASGTMIIAMVVYTERQEAIRIISARKATKQEKEDYYGNINSTW